MLNHQQIGEGEAFVEPRDVETVKGLLKAAEDLDLDPAVVRTQTGGYLAPVEVVEKWQETGAEGTVTRAGEEPSVSVTPEESTEVQPDDSQTPIVSEPTEEGAEVPAKSADKPTWVAYAETQGYDESEGLTKDQLIERYGATE